MKIKDKVVVITGAARGAGSRLPVPLRVKVPGSH